MKNTKKRPVNNTRNIFATQSLFRLGYCLVRERLDFDLFFNSIV